MANYLYNGVELPALPEWDKNTYPYSVIAQDSADSSKMYLLCGESPFVIKTFASGSTGLSVDNSENRGKGACLVYDYINGEWVFYREYLAIHIINGAGSFAYKPIWCDSDIWNVEYTDDTYDYIERVSVYLAASDPIPVTTAAPIDPTSFMQGWLVGRRIAAKRGKPKEET